MRQVLCYDQHFLLYEQCYKNSRPIVTQILITNLRKMPGSVQKIIKNKVQYNAFLSNEQNFFSISVLLLFHLFYSNHHMRLTKVNF